MSTPLIITLGIILTVILFALLRIFFGISFRDFILLYAVMMPTVWMTRLNVHRFIIEDSPFVLILIVQALMIIILFLFGSPNTVFLLRHRFRKVLLSFGCLLLVFILSIFFNAQQNSEFARGFLALCYAVMPFFSAFIITRCYSIDDKRVSRAILIFFAGGVLTSMFSILSAVSPGLFRSIVTTARTEVRVGRAFAPIGGANMVAMYLLLSYCLASGLLLAGRRRTISIIMIGISFLGMLTTLARGAILVLIPVNLYLYARFRHGMGRRFLIFLLTGCILLIPATYYLGKRYSLERLTEFEITRSVAFRAKSLKAALNYGFKRLPIGGGWGLVYDLQRRKAILKGEEAQAEISLDGLPSAASPHNLYALVFAESGIIGLSLLLLFFWSLWKAVLPPDPNIDKQGFEIVRGFRACLLGMFGMSLMQDHLFLTLKLSYAMYLVIFMGMLTSTYYNYQAYQLSELQYQRQQEDELSSAVYSS